MHGSRAENAALVEAIVHKLPNAAAEVWVCPPFLYLAEAHRALAGSRINLGAQDVCAETQGAFSSNRWTCVGMVSSSISAQPLRRAMSRMRCLKAASISSLRKAGLPRATENTM